MVEKYISMPQIFFTLYVQNYESLNIRYAEKI